MRDGIQIGQVSTRKGAKAHADIHGRAYCGAGRGQIIATTSRALTEDTATLVCRRCRRHLHEVAEQQLISEQYAPTNRYSEYRVQRAIRLVDALQSPAQRAARDADRAEFDQIAAAIATAANLTLAA
jgi:predicted SPOUT superfamily RNA methylase MTH1